MKVLLANPPTKFKINNKYEKYFVRAGSRWPHSGIKRLGELPHYIPFPFFLSYAATLLRNNKFDTVVIDSVAADICKDDFLSLVKKCSPDLLFFETSTPTINYDIALIKEIKMINNKTYICLGGPHATTFAEELMKENTEIDFIINGEYEFTLLSLCQCLKDNKDLYKVKGLVYRENSSVINNGFSPLIEPLDLLPIPDRDLFPLSWQPDPYVYWDGFCQLYPAFQMQSSRGCPYKCYFCLWPQVMYRSRKYRKFSVQRVVDEMKLLVNKYGAREIYIDDDDFTIDKSFVKDICKKILSEKLKVKWSVMGDMINLDEELIMTMFHAGLIGIKYGVETASRKTLQCLGKPINLEKVKNVTKILSKLGIKTHATFTLGLINETSETIMETINFAQRLDCDTIQVSIATPYPGTEFFYIAEKNKWLKNFSWEDFDGKVKEVIQLPTISSYELEKFRKKFVRKWLIKRILAFSWLFRQIKIIFRSVRYIGVKCYFKKIKYALINELGLIKQD